MPTFGSSIPSGITGPCGTIGSIIADIIGACITRFDGSGRQQRPEDASVGACASALVLSSLGRRRRIRLPECTRRVCLRHYSRRIDERAGDLGDARGRFGQELDALSEDLQGSSPLPHLIQAFPLAQLAGHEDQTVTAEVTCGRFRLLAQDHDGNHTGFAVFSRVQLEVELADGGAA
jgi:hypothetical protein